MAHLGSAYNFLGLWSVKTGTLSERRMSDLCRLAEQILEIVAGSDLAPEKQKYRNGLCVTGYILSQILRFMIFLI